jgi:hypothetical protein
VSTCDPLSSKAIGPPRVPSFPSPYPDFRKDLLYTVDRPVRATPLLLFPSASRRVPSETRGAPCISKFRVHTGPVPLPVLPPPRCVCMCMCVLLLYNGPAPALALAVAVVAAPNPRFRQIEKGFDIYVISHIRVCMRSLPEATPEIFFFFQSSGPAHSDRRKKGLENFLVV